MPGRIQWLGSWIVIFMGVSISLGQTVTANRASLFEDELKALQKAFQIPGMAVLVRENGAIAWETYLGYSDLEKQQPVTRTTRFPIASVSKTFAAVLIMQQVEKGPLSLEDPIAKWLPDKDISGKVKIKHLLSHTSEGDPGHQFLYSSRYSWLGSVLEKVTGKRYEDLMREAILSPLAMNETLPGLAKHTSPEVAHLATGYRFDGQLEATLPPLGLSAASGIISTIRDLAKFDAALDSHRVISKKSFTKMTQAFPSPTGQPLEYGLGIFVQSIQGEMLLWAYGQEDAFSCLFLKVPHRQLSLVLMANNNLLSDPARLIQGNLLRSRFALSFLRHFVFSHPSKSNSHQGGSLKRDETIAQVLQTTFFANYAQDMAQMKQAGEQLTALLQNHPELLKKGDISLRHACSMFPPEYFPDIASFAQKLDAQLVQRYPKNPYQLYYQAELEGMLNRPQAAAKIYQTLADLPNHVDNWYRLEAFLKLGQHFALENPALARRYFQRLAASRWNYRGLPKIAKTWLEANPEK